LHCHIGFRKFDQGISKLKQVTGREHRDIQRYIVVVTANAVPKDFLRAIHALMDFRYLAQLPEIDEGTCLKIEAALKDFHNHKQAILNAGARRGAANKPIENWYIPKLKFMQSVAPSVRNNGAAIQWSADVTERLHITQIKNAAHSSNNQDYKSQIVRSLDRLEKISLFDLATAMCEAGVEFG
jgi:hypothetical protein